METSKKDARGEEWEATRSKKSGDRASERGKGEEGGERLRSWSGLDSREMAKKEGKR